MRLFSKNSTSHDSNVSILLQWQFKSGWIYCRLYYYSAYWLSRCLKPARHRAGLTVVIVAMETGRWQHPPVFSVALSFSLSVSPPSSLYLLRGGERVCKRERQMRRCKMAIVRLIACCVLCTSLGKTSKLYTVHTRVSPLRTLVLS